MRSKNKIVLFVIIMVLAIAIISTFTISFIMQKENEVSIASEQKDEEKQIYDTVISSASYSADPTVPDNILNGINRHIVKIRVISTGEAKFLPTTEFYHNPYNPCTPIEIEVLQNLYGEPIQPVDGKIYISGGDIKLSNLITTLDEVDTERLGLNNLSEEERNSQYMRYQTKYSYDVQPNNEYIVVVAEIGDGLYKIVDEGCGIFINDSFEIMTKVSSETILRNVITNNTIEQTQLVQKAIEKKVDANTVKKLINQNKEK